MRKLGFRPFSRFPWLAERMEGKLFIVFLFLIILPIGALSYLSAQRYSDSIENNTITFVSQLSDQMTGKLDDYIEDMKKISIIPSYLDEIKNGLKMSNQFYEGMMVEPHGEKGEKGVLSQEEMMRLNIERQVGNSIYFINNIKKGTNTVYLFDRFGHPYFAVKSTSIRFDLSDVLPRWRQLAEEGHGTPVLVSTQEVAGQAMSKRYVFTVVRLIIDSTTFETIGMIGVDASIGVIDNIVKDLDRSTHGKTLIVDEGGSVVYDSEKQLIGRNLTDSELLPRATREQGSFHTKLDGKDVLAIYKESPVTGWKVLITIPEKELKADAMRTRNFTILMAIAIMCFALLISLVLVFALTKPLRSLVRMMKEVQTGNLDVTFPVVRRDEVGLVGSAFNRMLDRVKTLIQDIYKVEERKKEAEMQSLQHQINPHFIYNTLESIRMTAVLNDDKEVGDMTQLLGKLLRYSIHAGRETVPVGKEWEYLEIYVQLLNYRFGNHRFELVLPDPRETAGMSIMKLLFQPIVENAAYHGLQEGSEGMRIVISSRLDGTDRLFDVSDDGIGMDEATLREVREGLRSETAADDGHGIGLRNVHERIKLRYGEMYGLTVTSAPGVGTTVTVRLPAAVRGGGEPI
ncbi:cache domain-containing sensor histidine kinase [Cohnella nanjingensis]|uniref:histidine kinase n=1 Tax=Cohnella nanjingensis TaxID=1387779 RepID=A0A7X0RXK7_9BACL|nr:sensor histidine kinase [Cohnella nanjingensis]MBB6673954.1 sensor histidine kinase [Cohnella nanjingensis]